MPKNTGNFEERTRKFNQRKLYIGIALFVFMLALYSFKPFPTFLFGFPAVLFGLDPKDFLKR